MTQLFLTVLDPLLCWLLFLPPAMALAVVGAGTGLAVVLIRRCATDQDLLKRCRDDRRRLATLAREAKGRKDDAALRRHRRVALEVALRALRQEGPPFLLSVPVVLLTVLWCGRRLAHVPPDAYEPIAVEMQTSVGGPGQVAHIVPIEGGRSDTGWVRPLQERAREPGTYRASWRLRLPAKRVPHRIDIRWGRRGHSLPLLVGHGTYTTPTHHTGDEGVQVMVDLEPVRLFGVLPGVPALGLAPWLTGYLLVSVATALAFRGLLGVR